MMYHAYQAQSDLLRPLRHLAKVHGAMLGSEPPRAGLANIARPSMAASKVFELSEVTHRRPPWRIGSVMVEGEEQPVVEEVAARTPFAELLRFHKPGVTGQPRLLVVAPMSGHFATLLRDTVRTALPDHDVHVTDWLNVRDVPLAAGRFGLDEYIEHVMQFIAALGPGGHVLAVCQPTVAALAAVALMSEDRHEATPASLTLMAGPIDCRISPTAVNRLAMSRPIEWFEQNLISTVPWQHAGGGRRVYPGFVQLSAFISMNRERHENAFRDYYRQLLEGDFDRADVTRVFYEEYLAVADLSAEFYLETVSQVFQQFALPQGQLTFRGRKVDPAAIRRTALVTIEGERDDICAIGQTLAAQDLASSLRPYLRTHYVQPNVGHYGVFSGKRWQNQIYPIVRDVIGISG
ncbi:polyhydroxyalkanoate depolymerase [Scleromatobacter humisilvae]|uniref:Polyhydroxyalkanoate depolymerase n=1 Tax=Scleromatobacter humisilvae TaxID=2897159 RepID=A0A9X1YPI6_9BURK|nr:polyhydroxyalkanoate depolymerase [Scleromatobacter humisilvae]MCK9689370.1 polyhydroxyalkanoate depolymerase [Scleromatobacter humisilvae]